METVSDAQNLAVLPRLDRRHFEYLQIVLESVHRGTDAQEIRQDFGEAAKRLVSELVEGTSQFWDRSDGQAIFRTFRKTYKLETGGIQLLGVSAPV